MRPFIPNGLTKAQFVDRYSKHSVSAGELIKRAKKFKKSFQFRKAFMVIDNGFFPEIYLLQNEKDIHAAAKKADTLLLIENKQLAA